MRLFIAVKRCRYALIKKLDLQFEENGQKMLYSIPLLIDDYKDSSGDEVNKGNKDIVHVAFKICIYLILVKDPTVIN